MTSTQNVEDLNTLKARVRALEEHGAAVDEVTGQARRAARLIEGRRAYVADVDAANVAAEAAQARLTETASVPGASLESLFAVYVDLRTAVARRHAIAQATAGELDQLDELPAVPTSGASQSRRPRHGDYSGLGFDAFLANVIALWSGTAHVAERTRWATALDEIGDAAAEKARAAALASDTGQIDVDVPTSFNERYEREAEQLDRPTATDLLGLQRRLLVEETGAGKPPAIT
jgi:hypothetical protein